MTKQSTYDDDELSKLAPTLLSISKANEFQVPEGFFAEQADSMVSEASDIEELKTIAPVFSDLPKKDLLLTPEGFFSSFEKELQHKTQSGEAELKVPEGFFEEQFDSLTESHLEQDDEMVMPESFFEEQHAAIMAAVEEPENKSGKVVGFGKYRRMILSSVAAAAAIIAAFFMFSAEEEQCVTFACLLEQTDLSADDLLFMDDDDLNEFVDFEDAEEINEDDIEMIDYLIESEYDFDELYLEIQ